MPKKIEKPGIYFERIDKRGQHIHYPAWRYHDYLEPKIVYNTEEDDQARAEGWENPQVPITAVQNFCNYYHDLEDFNNEQLCYYAMAEFGVDLPVEAPKSKLLWAIWQLAANSKKTKNRIVLLAQSIDMNYDETVKEILRAAGDLNSCSEVTREEIWL